MDSPFDFYVNGNIDPNIINALSSDSPFDDYRSLPIVFSPFSLSTNLGSKKEEYLERDSSLSVGSISFNPPLNTGPRQQSSRTNSSPRPEPPQPGTSSPTPSTDNMNNTMNNTNNNMNNTNNNTMQRSNTTTTTPPQTTSTSPQMPQRKPEKIKTKKKTLFKKKKKKNSYVGAKLEDSYSNTQMQAEFLKFLKKKKGMEMNYKFLTSVKKFEEEGGDIHGRAMNICFEYLGIGGGENNVSVDNNIINELSQIIRNRGSSKEMFTKAKGVLENVLRPVFNDFIA